MRNYTLLFSFLLLFVVSDLDAQRSRRSSGRIDKAELNKSDKYLIHCETGYRSMIATSLLKKNGFKFADKEGK